MAQRNFDSQDMRGCEEITRSYSKLKMNDLQEVKQMRSKWREILNRQTNHGSLVGKLFTKKSFIAEELQVISDAQDANYSQLLDKLRGIFGGASVRYDKSEADIIKSKYFIIYDESHKNLDDYEAFIQEFNRMYRCDQCGRDTFCLKDACVRSRILFKFYNDISSRLTRIISNILRNLMV